MFHESQEFIAQIVIGLFFIRLVKRTKKSPASF